MSPAEKALEKSSLRTLAPEKLPPPSLHKILRVRKIGPHSYFTSNEFNKQPELKSHNSIELKINKQS